MKCGGSSCCLSEAVTGNAIEPSPDRSRGEIFVLRAGSDGLSPQGARPSSPKGPRGFSVLREQSNACSVKKKMEAWATQKRRRAQ